MRLIACRKRIVKFTSARVIDVTVNGLKIQPVYWTKSFSLQKRHSMLYFLSAPRHTASAWKHAGAGRQAESFRRENRLVKELMCSILLYIVNKLYHKNFRALLYDPILFLSFLVMGAISRRIWKNQFPSLKTFVHRGMREVGLLKDNHTYAWLHLQNKYGYK